MIHYLESVNLYLKANKLALNITSDALNLVEFIKENIINISLKGEVVDIGSGIGSLSFLLYKVENFTKFHCIEIQKEVYEVLEENIKLNSLDNFFSYNVDIKDFKGRYEFVISNPPFYSINSGKMPENEIMKISKFEIKLKLEDLMYYAYNLLKKEGYFFLILPENRASIVEKSNFFEIISSKKIVNKKKNFVMYNLLKKSLIN